MKKLAVGKYSVFIVDHVLNRLSNSKQKKRKQNESGGILLGQIKDENIYIMRISEPTSHDRSSRTSFVRKREKAQIIIDYEFANSDNKTIYLGEWHTHP